MGCGSSSQVTDPVIQNYGSGVERQTPPGKVVNQSTGVGNVNGTIGSKVIKPMEQTINKIMNVQRELDKNDPIFKLIERLEVFRKGFKGNKAAFETGFKLVQTILKNIANDFNNQKFKNIKKSNKKFSESIGKYNGGLELMQILGFRDNGDEIVFVEALPRSHIQMKIIDLNIAHNKINSN